MAQENARRNNVNNVNFKQSDWYGELASNQQFDLIVSNPPYIDEQDEHLRQGDVRFEPISALVADNQGMADIDIIARGAKNYLKPGGWLLFEHGYDQGHRAVRLLTQLGYSKVQCQQDFGGRDRVTLGQLL